MRKIVAMSFMLAGAAACGGAAPPPGPAPAMAAAPQTVAALTILLKPSRAPAVNAAAESALVAAGYTIVVDPRAQHDAEGQLVATETEVPSMFQVTVGGVRQRNLRVTVSLSLQSSGRIVDQVSTSFESKEAEIGPDKLGGLVSALNASSRVQKFAADRAVVAQQRATEMQQKADDDKAQMADEESAWTATVGDCRAPKDAHSCDSLKAWFVTDSRRLGMYGGGAPAGVDPRKLARRHQEADEILKASAPALRGFAETDAWTNIGLARCQSASSIDDCAAVHGYLQQFPDGAHVAEAQTAMDAGNKRLEAQAEAEAKRAAVRDRAAAGRAHQDQCRQKCSDDKCAAYTDPTKQAQCVQQCTAGC